MARSITTTRHSLHWAPRLSWQPPYLGAPWRRRMVPWWSSRALPLPLNLYAKNTCRAHCQNCRILPAPLCHAQNFVRGRRKESGVASGARPATPSPGRTLRHARPVPTCGHPNIGRHFQPLHGPGQSSKGAFNPDATWYHCCRTSMGAATQGTTAYHPCCTSEGEKHPTAASPTTGTPPHRA
jgi:hypothetical protein